MFTRYSDVDVPDNYSGNRFRKKSIDDTTIKLHKGTVSGASRTTISPSFEQKAESDRELHKVPDITIEELENRDFEEIPSEEEDKSENALRLKNLKSKRRFDEKENNNLSDGTANDGNTDGNLSSDESDTDIFPDRENGDENLSAVIPNTSQIQESNFGKDDEKHGRGGDFLSKFSGIKLPKMDELFKEINSDDLLLIFLILLLYGEGNSDNVDLLIILSLLLLYRG